MKDKKKIIHLITNLKVGGAQKMLLRLLPALQNKFENTLCCAQSNEQLGDDFTEKSIPLHYLHFKSFFQFDFIKRFRKILTEEKPDLIVTYLTHADIFGRVWGRLFGIKKIVCSIRVNTRKFSLPLFILDGLTSPLVTHYHFNSRPVMEMYQKWFFLSEKKTTYIPNGVDNIERYFMPLDREYKIKQLGLPPNKKLLGCVARLSRQKGHENLLLAFSKLLSKRQDTILVLVGDGEEKDNLNQLIKQLNLTGWVFLLGERNDVPEILQVTDIFILPSLYEGMSNALLEAMAAKKPIIATAIKENLSVLHHERTALLYAANDTDTLCAHIYTLLNDAELRATIARNAHNEFNEKYTIDGITKQYSEMLEKV